MTVLPVRRPRADVRRDLALLAKGRAPFVSVYLDISPGEPRTTAVSTLRSELDRLDVGVEAVDRQRIEAAIVEASDDVALFAAIANAGGGLVTATYPDPPRRNVVTAAGVPRLGPLLAAEQSLTHHLVALIRDDELALMTVPRHGEATQATYAGQDRLAIAPIVQHACRTSDTRLLIVCAPADELEVVADQIRSGLGVDVDLATVPLDGLDDGDLATEIVVRTADHAAAKTVELLRLFRFHRSHDEAVAGASATASSLADGRAALVLINDDENDDRQGWLVPDEDGFIPVVDAGEHDPVDGWRAGRLTDVVICAAIAAGCGVHLVPSVDRTLADGFGAILADRASPASLAELLER